MNELLCQYQVFILNYFFYTHLTYLKNFALVEKCFPLIVISEQISKGNRECTYCLPFYSYRVRNRTLWYHVAKGELLLIDFTLPDMAYRSIDRSLEIRSYRWNILWTFSNIHGFLEVDA